MQIVIIGTGNIATVLGKKLKAAGHVIVQVYGRNYESAIILANELQAHSCSQWNAITTNAELYIIAIADKVLVAHEIQLKLDNQLVVHTAGSVSMDVLANISSSYGVLYPYQTIRKEIEPLPETPLLIDANSAGAKQQLIALAKTISEKVIMASDTERIKYHLAAVIANNFSNYLYVLVEDYCKKNGLDFNNLLPLVDETAGRLHHFSPLDVQTGPAIRKDTGTIHHHLDLLKDDPALKKLYQMFSEAIMQFNWPS